MSDHSPATPVRPAAPETPEGPPDPGARPPRFYLPQLDGLRFFAFLLVFIHHAPRTSGLFGRGSGIRSTVHFIEVFGWCGVDLFLVLSAFLITTLLLIEHERRGRISVSGFYVRRMLRIWPLYYLMLLIGFFALPAAGLFAPPLGSPAYAKLLNRYLLAYLTLFSNYSVGAWGYPSVATLSHLWTVALEEQFYIVWPALLIILLRFKRASVVWATLAALLVLTITVRFQLLATSRNPAIWTNTLSRLDPLILGVGLAFWRRRHAARAAWPTTVLQVLLGVTLVASIGRAPAVQLQLPDVLWQYLATAAGFTLILDAALSASPNPFAWLLSRRPLVWLGKISYGLYIYHLLGFNVSLLLLQEVQRRFGVRSPAEALTMRIGIALSLTSGTSALSYRFFESYFLKLKERFSRVRSGPVPEPQGRRSNSLS